MAEALRLPSAAVALLSLILPGIGFPLPPENGGWSGPPACSADCAGQVLVEHYRAKPGTTVVITAPLILIDRFHAAKGSWVQLPDRRIIGTDHCSVVDSGPSHDATVGIRVLARDALVPPPASAGCQCRGDDFAHIAYAENPGAAWLGGRRPVRVESFLAEPGSTVIFAEGGRALIAEYSCLEAFWVVGSLGQSCDDACAAYGRCSEGRWPESRGDFEQIVKTLGFWCADLLPEGELYDPSILMASPAALRTCRWSSNRPTGGSCSAKPPSDAARFCPCMWSEGDHSGAAADRFACRTVQLLHGSASWVTQDEWSEERRSWCCEHKGTGCSPPLLLDLPTDDPAEGTTDVAQAEQPVDEDAEEDAFDCEFGCAGFSPQECARKVGWCCEHDHCDVPWITALTVPSPAPAPSASRGGGTGLADCRAAAAGPAAPVLAQWKLEYCCVRYKVACPTTTTTPAPPEPFSCSGDAGERSAWSPAAREWCCAHHGKGCPATSSRASAGDLHDCGADPHPHSLHLWSEGRRRWCCEHKQVGCRPAAHRPASATSAAAGTSASARAPAHAHTATSARARAPAHARTPTTTTTRRVEASSSSARAHAHHTTTTTARPAAASARARPTTAERRSHASTAGGKAAAGRAAARAGAAATKRRNATASRAGHSDSISRWDGCDRGQAHWEEEWPAEKKAWCCEHEGRGCPPVGRTTASTTTHPAARLAVHQSPGAAPPARRPAASARAAPSTSRGWDGCSDGLQNWRETWPADKKEWCCHHEGVACEGGAPLKLHLSRQYNEPAHAGQADIGSSSVAHGADSGGTSLLSRLLLISTVAAALGVLAAQAHSCAQRRRGLAGGGGQALQRPGEPYVAVGPELLDGDSESCFAATWIGEAPLLTIDPVCRTGSRTHRTLRAV